MRRKILAGALAVAVVTLSVGIVAVVLIRSSIRERAQEELFRQAEVTAGFLEEELTGITVDPTRVGAEQRAAWRTKVAAVLRQARLVGGHDIVEAELVTGGRSVSLVRNPKLLSVLPVGTRERTVVRVEVDGTPMLATVRSFPFGRRSEIVVAIGRSEPLLPVRFVTRTLLLALAVGAVLVVGLGLWFARSTTGRLRHLEEASLRLAGGDLAARVPVEGHDELTALARAFNEMADQLEGVRRRERDFLMSVGHDLRTPLTSIRGYAEALDAGDVTAEELPRVAGVLHRQTDRLGRLIEDLMLLARIESREFTIRAEPVDLVAHLKELVDGYRPRTDAARVRLSFAGDPDVGTVLLDPDRMAQICGNLLDNALRYTPEGGRVTVALHRRGGDVELSIADTGPGIDPEDLPRVFERLYVARRYRPVRPEGSGLGLAIVKELVDAMGGRVTVESRPGHGTVIRVLVPGPPA